MLMRAFTFPLCVTVHVVFAVANHWRTTPETFDLFSWPDEETAPAGIPSSDDRGHGDVPRGGH
ncbi:MAG TPA: hypothetical protein VFG87_25610 [Amycolatopsis sp.]|nr:hypothetical protein [Amycolatopsis sp.]